ncbi:MAG: heavy metal-associated domain-containing protein [Eubacteriales bacterium]|nr:heavy metal-associated domain-containing protein [Eubacteriales bacterium]
MKQRIMIEGMMCAHCEAHVTKALEALDGVKKVKASAPKKEAIVTVDTAIDEAVLTAAVSEAGYQVTGIEIKKGLF